MADPQTLSSIRYKTRKLALGPKFDTDSRILNPKATGLHLVGVKGHTLTSTLALPASLAEVGARTADPPTLSSIRYKTRKLARGSQV